MLSLLLAELRAARGAWLGVSVSFLVANLALAVPLLVLGAVVRASGLPGIDAGIAVVMLVIAFKLGTGSL